jgi:predicted DNA-binding transcriptional regulator AlpA
MGKNSAFMRDQLELKVGSHMPKLLLFPELIDHGVFLGRRQIDRLEKIGKFPKRVAISERRVAWIEAEIDDHVSAKVQQRA